MKFFHRNVRNFTTFRNPPEIDKRTSSKRKGSGDDIIPSGIEVFGYTAM
ncbi:hypothetical protein [Prosthecochloris sp. HL-130-GSB]|nr:hypothetical protein [Prosthecochloris sp. HL-130-GSB]